MSSILTHAEIMPRIASVSTGERLFDQVVEILAMGIVAGRYAAGSVLPNEDKLATGISVSRSAYREALKFLTSKGLIEAKPRVGTRVRPQSDWNLLDPDILRWTLKVGPTPAFARDLFELRRTIEPEAARLAALRHTAHDAARIEEALMRMETLAPLGAASIAADLDFHERILEASGNRALACLKNVVAATILWSQEIKKIIGPAEFTASLRDHRRIFEAIKARDGDLAAARMTLLVADAFDHTAVAIDATRRRPRAIPPRPKTKR